jgi:hypothetical protein
MFSMSRRRSSVSLDDFVDLVRLLRGQRSWLIGPNTPAGDLKSPWQYLSFAPSSTRCTAWSTGSLVGRMLVVTPDYTELYRCLWTMLHRVRIRSRSTFGLTYISNHELSRLLVDGNFYRPAKNRRCGRKVTIERTGQGDLCGDLSNHISTSYNNVSDQLQTEHCANEISRLK